MEEGNEVLITSLVWRHQRGYDRLRVRKTARLASGSVSRMQTGGKAVRAKVTGEKGESPLKMTPARR